VKTILILAAAAGLIAAQPTQASEKKVETEQEFRALLVDKRLVDHNGDWAMINADGTLDGVFDGKKMTGTWHWKDGELCRDARIDARDFKDCQIWAVDGSMATVARDDGQGEKVEYRIEAP
jgi:hypothetical protein